MNPYDIVDAFEKKVAEYAGSKYGVAVNSCSNALMLSAVYRRMNGCYISPLVIPKYTYIGVVYALINAGFKVEFSDVDWRGAYAIYSVNECYEVGTDINGTGFTGIKLYRDGLKCFGVIDSARRFTKDMYIPNTLYCLSFHWYKHLPVGRGGMILTDDKDAYETLKKIRFDGRTAGLAPKDDTFNTPGYHCYMIPEDATRGLMLMGNMKDHNEDLSEHNYTDLSEIEYFKVEGGL